MVSGGTNTKTFNLAKLCGINIHGIGMGSFARQYIKEYIDNKDLFENNDLFNDVCKKAKKLIAKLF